MKHVTETNFEFWVGGGWRDMGSYVVNIMLMALNLRWLTYEALLKTVNNSLSFGEKKHPVISLVICHLEYYFKIYKGHLFQTGTFDFIKEEKKFQGVKTTLIVDIQPC